MHDGLVPFDRLTCEGFEPPLAGGPVRVKKNRVLPHKARLSGHDGMEVTDLELETSPVIQVMHDSGAGSASDVTDDALPAGQGTEGNQFYFDFSGKWQFNLKTKNYTAPGTYHVTMVSGDLTEYDISPVCEATFVIE